MAAVTMPVEQVRKPADWISADRSLLFLLRIATALSGAAALVYQVLWVRQLGLVVGMEVYSITIAVSAFFAGLAAGSVTFGRKADRVASAARFYAALEIAVALFAVATTLICRTQSYRLCG